MVSKKSSPQLLIGKNKILKKFPLDEIKAIGRLEGLFWSDEMQYVFSDACGTIFYEVSELIKSELIASTNNVFKRALFSNPSNWRKITLDTRIDKLVACLEIMARVNKTPIVFEREGEYIVAKRNAPEPIKTKSGLSYTPPDIEVFEGREFVSLHHYGEGLPVYYGKGVIKNGGRLYYIICEAEPECDYDETKKYECRIRIKDHTNVFPGHYIACKSIKDPRPIDIKLWLYKGAEKYAKSRIAELNVPYSPFIKPLRERL